jgi:PAS domain S-box-containing protein
MNSVLLVQNEISSLDNLKEDIVKVFKKFNLLETDDLQKAYKISKEEFVEIIFIDLDVYKDKEIIEFITKLQNHISTDKIPVIFVTESKGDEFISKMTMLKGHDFVQKPVDKNIFVFKLNHYLKLLKRTSGAETVINESLIYTETDASGIITKVSKKFELISGYTKEELIGKPHNIVRHPNMPSSAFKDMWNTIQSGYQWEGIVKNRKKNGESYVVKATVYPIKNQGNIIGYASTRHDITKEIIEKQRNKKILDAQYSLIIILKNRKVSYINKTLFHHYDYKNIKDFKSKHSCICELFEKHSDEALMPQMDGGVNWIDYIKENNRNDTLVYMTDKHENIRIYDAHFRGNIAKNEEIIVLSDVTHLKRQSETLQQQSRFAAMGEMIAMIAHQWRQPLAAMKALMIKLNFKKELGQLDDEIWEESIFKHEELLQYMSQTIDDFKDFFKGNAEFRDENIYEIVHRPYRLVESLFKNNNVSFESNFDSEALKNEDILTVKSKLDQVIMNIYKNALDIFIEKKSSDAKINVECFKDEKYVIFKICDNAGGIPEDILGKIFDPYFSTKGDNGTGIGLYMSKVIIESHLKGKLEASNENSGACFTVKLPYNKSN